MRFKTLWKGCFLIYRYAIFQKNFDIEDDNGFITSIDGHEQDEKDNKYWTYTINDEEVMEGASEVELTAGDKVDFSLSEME